MVWYWCCFKRKETCMFEQVGLKSFSELGNSVVKAHMGLPGCYILELKLYLLFGSIYVRSDQLVQPCREP